MSYKPLQAEAVKTNKSKKRNPTEFNKVACDLIALQLHELTQELHELNGIAIQN